MLGEHVEHADENVSISEKKFIKCHSFIIVEFSLSLQTTLS